MLLYVSLDESYTLPDFESAQLGDSSRIRLGYTLPYHLGFVFEQVEITLEGTV